MLYFPSTGTYYSPRYIADTSRLRAKGLCLLDESLATSIVLQMLPATSLQIQQDSTSPGDGGHLKVFTNIYQIDVESSVSQILTLPPVLHGLHLRIVRFASRMMLLLVIMVSFIRLREPQAQLCASTE